MRRTIAPRSRGVIATLVNDAVSQCPRPAQRHKTSHALTAVPPTHGESTTTTTSVSATRTAFVGSTLSSTKRLSSTTRSDDLSWYASDFDDANSKIARCVVAIIRGRGLGVFPVRDLTSKLPDDLLDLLEVGVKELLTEHNERCIATLQKIRSFPDSEDSLPNRTLAGAMTRSIMAFVHGASSGAALHVRPSTAEEAEQMVSGAVSVDHIFPTKPMQQSSTRSLISQKTLPSAPASAGAQVDPSRDGSLAAALRQHHQSSAHAQSSTSTKTQQRKSDGARRGWGQSTIPPSLRTPEAKLKEKQNEQLLQVLPTYYVPVSAAATVYCTLMREKTNNSSFAVDTTKTTENEDQDHVAGRTAVDADQRGADELSDVLAQDEDGGAATGDRPLPTPAELAAFAEALGPFRCLVDIAGPGSLPSESAINEDQGSSSITKSAVKSDRAKCETSPVAATRAFISLLPPYHRSFDVAVSPSSKVFGTGAVESTAGSAMSDLQVPEYDTFRLARYLSSDFHVDIAELQAKVGGILSRHALDIVVANPMLFEYHPPRQNADGADYEAAVENGENDCNNSSGGQGGSSPLPDRAVTTSTVASLEAIFAAARDNSLPDAAFLLPQALEEEDANTAARRDDSTSNARASNGDGNSVSADSDTSEGRDQGVADSSTSNDATDNKQLGARQQLGEFGTVRFLISAAEVKNTIGPLPPMYDSLSIDDLTFVLRKYSLLQRKKLPEEDQQAVADRYLGGTPMKQGIRLVKEKHKIIRSMLKKRFPHGNPFMDRNVLAYFIFDLLPPDESVDVLEFRNTFFPENARTVAPMTSMYLNSYPHLFKAFQPDMTTNAWFLQRADSETMPNVRGAGEFSDLELLEFIFSSAPESFDVTRPVSSATIKHRMSEVLKETLRGPKMMEFLEKFPDLFKVTGTDFFFFLTDPSKGVPQSYYDSDSTGSEQASSIDNEQVRTPSRTQASSMARGGESTPDTARPNRWLKSTPSPASAENASPTVPTSRDDEQKPKSRWMRADTAPESASDAMSESNARVESLSQDNNASPRRSRWGTSGR